MRRWRVSLRVRNLLWVAAMTMLFWIVSAVTTWAAAKDKPKGQSGGLLSPFNVKSSEGIPLNHYTLVSDPGGLTDFQDKALSFLMGGMFAFVLIFIGLICWLIDWVYRFPIVSGLTEQAQKLADAYNTHVVKTLGLEGLMLAWAFVFGLILVMRGKVGRGLGEIGLTLVIAGLASSALVRPDVILGQDGPVRQSQQASLEIGAITASGGKAPPDSPEPRDISEPTRNLLTKVFVVQPYQLLQYGELLDRKSEEYEIHKKILQLGGPDFEDKGDGKKKQCMGFTDCPDDFTPSKELCEERFGEDDELCKDASNPTSWENLRDRLEDAGREDLAEYLKEPTWDRMFSALLLLIAAGAAGLMALSMAFAHLGVQFIVVCAAVMVYLVLAWAMLPGPNRQVVWKWTGIFISAVAVIFVVSVAIPLYGLGTEQVLTDTNDGLLVTRMLMVDAIAIAALGFHRRLRTAASNVGQRFADRMRWARVGGTHMHGDDAARTGLAMSAALAPYLHGAGGGGRGGAMLGGGVSPEHTSLMRRNKIAAHVGAMTDSAGMPGGASGLLAAARGEARLGLAPFGLVARGLQQLAIGKPLSPEKLARLRRPTGQGGPMVISDKGEILRDPAGGFTPMGDALHNRLINTRAGRMLVRGGQVLEGAHAVTLGLPRTWTRVRTGQTQMQQYWGAQLAHSRQADQDYQQEYDAGLDDMRRAGRWVADQGLRGYTAAQVHGRDLARNARDSAVAASIFASSPSPSGSAGPAAPATAQSAEADREARAQAQILDELMRAQRTAWTDPPTWGGDGS